MSPDRRTHRGAHPQDEGLFAAERLSTLRAAFSDLTWLLTRGYAIDASLKLVGDRFQLEKRQRIAVMRSVCSDQALRERKGREVMRKELSDQTLYIDGFNLLITVEAALGGGVILEGRDGCYRDLASVHGTYRTVHETESALLLIADEMSEFGPAHVVWYLDKPVSNSGRLAMMIRSIAEEKSLPWEVELVLNPDAVLGLRNGLVISSDSAVLDKPVEWLNLARHIIEKRVINAWIVSFSEQAG